MLVSDILLGPVIGSVIDNPGLRQAGCGIPLVPVTHSGQACDVSWSRVWSRRGPLAPNPCSAGEARSWWGQAWRMAVMFLKSCWETPSISLWTLHFLELYIYSIIQWFEPKACLRIQPRKWKRGGGRKAEAGSEFRLLAPHVWCFLGDSNTQAGPGLMLSWLNFHFLGLRLG